MDSVINTDEELRQHKQGLATLLEVTRNLAATLDVQKVLQATVDGVTKLVGLETAAVYLLDGEMLRLWAATPPIQPQFSEELRVAPLADHPHIQKAITSGDAVLVPDMVTADLSPAERAVTEQRNLRTVLFVPLIVEGKSMGAFIVGSIEKPSSVSETGIALARTLANLVALTVKNAQLYKDTQKTAAQLEQSLIERIKAEEEWEKLQGQLVQSQKIESVGRLASGVAHDFNNMLGVILGYTELALTKIDTDQPLYNDLLQIRKATERSANLTRQLLAFARKQAIEPKVINLNDVIGDMLKMLRRLIGEDIDLAWMPGEDVGLVNMDPAQVDQILANLCVNARDAISGVGRVGRVTIETGNATFDEAYCAEHPGFLPGNYVMIAVSDNGIGMDQETVANIFDPYFSTKKAGKGTGLGLSTVYGIVRQNNGFINVYSERGLGTTIKIYLARYEAGGRASEIKPAAQIAKGGSETILLVEDEPMTLAMGRSMLESLGYQVLAANSPSEALRHTREHSGKIDLLITDVVMPEMSGHELAGQLETILPGLKTLYISGYTANVIADRGVLSEGMILLSKPFSRLDLANKIREALTETNPFKNGPGKKGSKLKTLL